MAGLWLVLCTVAFHSMLEVQLTFSHDDDGAADGDGGSGACSGLFRERCEARVAAARAQSVRNGMLHAWAGYKAFAWGADEIHPKSKSAKTDVMVRGRGAPAWWGASQPWGSPAPSQPQQRAALR